METPSAVRFLFNDSGEMPNSCSMGVAPMRFCVTIWEGFTVKINLTPVRIAEERKLTSGDMAVLAKKPILIEMIRQRGGGFTKDKRRFNRNYEYHPKLGSAIFPHPFLSRYTETGDCFPALFAIGDSRDESVLSGGQSS